MWYSEASSQISANRSKIRAIPNTLIEPPGFGIPNRIAVGTTAVHEKSLELNLYDTGILRQDMETVEDSVPPKSREWRSRPALWFVSLMVCAGVLGNSIPAFYEWTDSDQSRPSSLLWQFPLGLLIVSFGFCCLLPWIPITKRQAEGELGGGRRFSLLFLLVVTSLVAVGIVVGMKFPEIVAGIVGISALVYCTYFFIRFAEHRLAVTALVICMLAPYAWLATYDELERLLPALPVFFGGMPTFLPGMWLAMLLGVGRQDFPWVACVLTATEVMAGLWMIGLGPKRTIAFLLFAMQVSLLSSLVFHQLILA